MRKEEKMSVKKLTPFLVVLILSLGTRPAWCQTTGRISGKVTDTETGGALPGANVLLKGTGLGASTDLNGRYSIGNIPPGRYTIRVTYVGYKDLEASVQINGGEDLSRDFKLVAVGVHGKAVIVTAQASGQNAAINEQLSSNRIMDAVSAARIKELPDANAAESVARLPGVYLVRQGGQGTELAIRGLAPQYNEVMIDGVKMAATSSNDRSVNLSMISSSMLSSIQLYKTVTPDMDAAVLGGVVNFQIREAKQNSAGGPEIELSTQGSYDNLQNTYNDYKVSGAIGDRFFDKRFGILVQAVVQRVNLTSDQFGGSYYLLTKNYGKPNPLALSSLSLTYTPSSQRTYDGTIVMDYRLPRGKIDFMNFFSSGDTKTESRNQSYNLQGNSITYGAGYSPNILNVMTNLLAFKQDFSLFKMNVKLSHSYSENISPGSWGTYFLQAGAGLSTIPSGENPLLIAQAGASKTVPSNMYLDGFGQSNSFLGGRVITGSIDLERSVNLSDLVTSELKIGGEYKYSHRHYNYGSAGGLFYDPSYGGMPMRAAVIKAYPWMAQPPYNLASDGSQLLPLTVFQDPGYSYGKFLNGNYTMGTATNFGMISEAINIARNLWLQTPFGVGGDYSPNSYASGASNYSGNEYESAGYAMAVVNIGSQLTIIPGVRYQGLETSYKAARYYNASAEIPWPGQVPHQDTAITEYHGYWLPDVSLRYKPFSWFDIRLAYTNTLSYPNYSAIIPRIDVFTSSVTWNNYALKPATSRNYDVQLSLYDNSIGLLTGGAFLKQINDLIFGSGGIYITDPSVYPGIPSYTKGYFLSTSINNPYRVNLWGTEFNWQTHFWYLPGPLSGIVLNVNYTHIFSGAKYPYVLSKPGVYPTFIPVHVDTFYTDRLIDQPNDIVNLSVGYDYWGFSAIASMIYQANVFSGTNFWPELRSYKSNYLRWDIVVKQDLPWYGLEAYLDLNNINGASDIYVVQGSGFPTSESDYGMTADLGLRWSLH